MRLDEVRLDPVTGWCHGTRHCPSPNFNTRPGDEVSLLVIHNISLPPGQFGTGQVQAFFRIAWTPLPIPISKASPR